MVINDICTVFMFLKDGGSQRRCQAFRRRIILVHTNNNVICHMISIILDSWNHKSLDEAAYDLMYQKFGSRMPVHEQDLAAMSSCMESCFSCTHSSLILTCSIPRLARLPMPHAWTFLIPLRAPIPLLLTRLVRPSNTSICPV